MFRSKVSTIPFRHCHSLTSFSDHSEYIWIPSALCFQPPCHQHSHPSPMPVVIIPATLHRQSHRQTYLEWLISSSLAQTSTCRSCHTAIEHFAITDRWLCDLRPQSFLTPLQKASQVTSDESMGPQLGQILWGMVESLLGTCASSPWGHCNFWHADDFKNISEFPCCLLPSLSSGITLCPHLHLISISKPLVGDTRSSGTTDLPSPRQHIFTGCCD